MIASVTKEDLAVATGSMWRIFVLPGCPTNLYSKYSHLSIPDDRSSHWCLAQWCYPASRSIEKLARTHYWTWFRTNYRSRPVRLIKPLSYKDKHNSNNNRHTTSVIPTLEPRFRDAAIDSYALAIRVVFICQAAANFMTFLCSLPIQENPLPYVCIAKREMRRQLRPSFTQRITRRARSCVSENARTGTNERGRTRRLTNLLHLS